MPVKQRWKGKERAMYVELDGRDEGAGGEDGVVLSLTLVGSGLYDAAYTIPVNLGDKNQQFSLQIDTGSSDLWIASTSCSSPSCSHTKGHLYDPTGATQTGVDFSIPYLSGSAAGPIVWDKVTIGGYTINNQALAAANEVGSEALAPNFCGILGLALPLNSIIAYDIPPVTNNDPDGAAWASNLFSLTPISTAPSSRFLSLALSRPGSDRIPAVFGIGRHPSTLVPDPSLVQYSTVVSDKPGTLFWKVNVKAITVYVNGTARRVELERSNTGAPTPIAVLDSGVSLILTTSNIANGIYGAIGVSPASDGMYYVPCTTPLNMSITLDNRPEIPLHPLDLTAEPPSDNQAQFCIGLIQTVDPQLLNPFSALGDMILGVPFLRNVYTVMAYTNPDADGSFVPLNSSNQTITPRLGLLSLTDPAIALEEFNTVRVLNQPISDGAGSSGNSSSSAPGGGSASNSTVSLGGKKLSVGIVVLIGLLSFFALCCVLFAIRWFTFRRKYRRAAAVGMDQTDKKSSTTEVYMLTKTTYSKDEKSSFGDNGYVGEATLAASVKEENTYPDSSISRDRAKLALADDGEDGDDEFSVTTEHVVSARGRESGTRDAEWESPVDDTLVQSQQNLQKLNTLCRVEEPHSSLPSSSSSSPSSPNRVAYNPHSLPSQTQHPLTPTYRQSPVLDPLPHHNQMSSSNYDHDTEPEEDLDEFGIMNNGVRTSMAGIGTASRTSKINFLRDMNMNGGGVMITGKNMANAEFNDDDHKGPSSPTNISTRTS
ncbi:acid protease [Phlegmacium glaucopus]|nr:acid protease [Phlegmacium glaucopus]